MSVYVIRTLIFTLVCFGVLASLEYASSFVLDMNSIFIAWGVAWINSFLGLGVFEFSKKKHAFYKLVAIGQGVRIMVVLTATLVFMMIDIVSKLDYVLGFVLFVPVFILMETMVYYAQLKEQKM